MDFILKTTNLSRNFGKHSAVTDVSIHVREKSVYGLLGPNGAGKSTILNMITGMLRPTSGTIEFSGHAWNRQDLKHIGALTENPSLYENILSEVQLIADDTGMIANGKPGYEDEMQRSGNLEELFFKVAEESRR